MIYFKFRDLVKITFGDFYALIYDTWFYKRKRILEIEYLKLLYPEAGKMFSTQVIISRKILIIVSSLRTSEKFRKRFLDRNVSHGIVQKDMADSIL